MYVRNVEFGDLVDTGMDVLNRAVAAIRVDTTLGPPLYIPDPFQTRSGAAESASAAAAAPAGGLDPARILKPKVTFVMREGWGGDRSLTPYGEPGTTKWPLVVAGLGIIFGFAIFGGWTAAKR